nr:protein gamma response 1-like [Maniola hyperantus]
MAPVYKEPTVRKKAEKRALPGWSCDQCKIFYDELYKDDPEMLAQLMDECSKHRGRTNPVRPNTPGGFWDPRWDVPQDTEEFNRRNNAV